MQRKDFTHTSNYFCTPINLVYPLANTLQSYSKHTLHASKKISLLSSPTTSLCCGLLRNSMQISFHSVLDPQLAEGKTFKTTCYSETNKILCFNNIGIRVLRKTVKQERDNFNFKQEKTSPKKIKSYKKYSIIRNSPVFKSQYV